MAIYDVLMYCFADVLSCVNRSTRLEGDLTSVQITQDSQYALINHSPNVRGLVCYYIGLLLILDWLVRKSTFGTSIRAE